MLRGPYDCSKRSPAAWTRRETLKAMLATSVCLPAMTGAASVAQSRPSTVEVESSGFLPVPGGRVWWQKFGSGSRTPLLVVHGGPGAAHNYLLPLSLLANERPVIFYDQLGCGLSDAPENETLLYNMPRFVQELHAVRTAFDLDCVSLYAHSWGTMIAIEYMLSGGAAGVQRLVLGSAIASMPQYVAGLRRLVADLPNDVGARLLRLEAEGLTTAPEYTELLQVFFRQHLLRSAPSQDVQASLAFLNKSPARRILYGPNYINVKGKIKTWDRRAGLGSIRAPTLIITGEYDEVTLECHETIRDRVAGSKLRVLSNCSHFTMQEAPETYAELVRAFIS